jgi:hypothetical protein
MNPILLYIWWCSIALGTLDVVATRSAPSKHKTGAALNNYKAQRNFRHLGKTLEESNS